jgi:hypothetical protein
MTREEIDFILRRIQKIESKLELDNKLTHPSTWEPESNIYEQLKWVFEVNNIETNFNWSDKGCVTRKVKVVV